MANLTLAQLREAQKANPPTVEEGGRVVNPAWLALDGVLMCAQPGAYESINIGPPPVTAAGPAAGASLPLQASAPVPAAVPGGYCRIFPPTFPSIAAIDQAWKDANWTGPSPWCHVEGAERHPDFEANLLAVEAQDVKPKEKGLTFDANCATIHQ